MFAGHVGAHVDVLGEWKAPLVRIVGPTLPEGLTEAELAAAAEPGMPAKEPQMELVPPPSSPTGAPVISGQSIALKILAIIVLVATGVAVGQPDLIPGSNVDQQVAQLIVGIGTVLGIVSPGIRK